MTYRVLERSAILQRWPAAGQWTNVLVEPA
jgi:hypothetical protein